MLIKIHPENPDKRKIKIVADTLREGGVIIYPTDTVYGIACDMKNLTALERVARIKGVKREMANFSLICFNLSHLADFCKPIDTSTFKIMKKALPGPFTFILNANSNVPKIFKSKKRTIGIRVPDNNIAREIVNELGNPIISTSLKENSPNSTVGTEDYLTDPGKIHEKYGKLVDLVIDGGFGYNEASTIIDCTGTKPELVRQGIGIIEGYL